MSTSRFLTIAALLAALMPVTAWAQKTPSRDTGATTKNDASGFLSFIGGGADNTASGSHTFIGSGALNVAAGHYSTVGGGDRNEALQWGSAVLGGGHNLADGENATIAGGLFNHASGIRSAIGGGEFNDTRGQSSVVPGGFSNCAGGDYSFAGGLRARVRPGTAVTDSPCTAAGSTGSAGGDAGTFVWADSAGAGFTSTGANQFLVRAGGGMSLNTTAVPLHTTLTVKGRPGSNGNANLYLEHATANAGVNLGVGLSGGVAQLYFARFNRSSYTDLARFRTDGRFEVFVDNPIKPGGGSWAAPSDARLKADVQPLQGALAKLLALHGVSFRYRDDAPDHYRVPGTHLGFVAQDVETVFPDWVGRDERGYRVVGPRGFEALTVEALRELQGDTTAQLAELRAENLALREALAAMRAEIAALHDTLAPARLADAR